VAVRGRFMVLRLGVWGRPPTMLPIAMLLLALVSDVVRPVREAMPATVLLLRPSGLASARVGLEQHRTMLKAVPAAVEEWMRQ